MAIQFTTGTINQPDAGSVGLSMVEKIRDDVIAHAAWELADEFTPGSGLVRWYVFKCLAAQSGLPSDFFVVIGRTIGSGELRSFICEGYNSTTKVVSFYGYVGNSASITYDSSGRGPATYTLGTAVLPTGSTATSPKFGAWVPSGTSTKYWIAVDDDGFSVAFNGASNGFIHCGAYIPLCNMPHPMPIQLIDGSSTSGMMTRNPAVPGITTVGAALWIEGGGAGNAATNSSPGLGFRGELRYNDKLQSDQRPVAEQGINVYQNTGGLSEIYGWALGKQKRMRVGATTAPAGIAFGDAYVLQGRLWVPYLPTGIQMWDTGVAS
jgi:hypothetical protein